MTGYFLVFSHDPDQSAIGLVMVEDQYYILVRLA